MNGEILYQRYQPEHRSAVIDLLQYLWKGDSEYRNYYFTWKYDEHPFTEWGEGIVAVVNNLVVGFRGLYPMLWEYTGELVPILALADTVVHPDYRGQGIFMNATKAMLEIYQGSKFLYSINLSSSNAPLNGYLKLGWRPIVPKLYTRCFRLSPRRLVKSMIMPSSDSSVASCRPGEPEFIRFQQKIRQKLTKDLFRVSYSDNYLQWRYRKPGNQYRAFYIDGVEQSYILLRELHQRIYLLDYESTNMQLFSRLIKQLWREYPGKTIAVWWPHDSQMKHVFNQSGFLTGKLIEYVETRYRDSSPILIRTLSENINERLNSIQDAELLNKRNWHFREIDSDGS